MGIKVETAGWKPWVEVQSFEGKDREGNKIGRQAFRNTLTGAMVFPEKGWDGDLSKLDHGDIACVITASDKYRQNYAQIRWGQACSESESPQSGS